MQYIPDEEALVSAIPEVTAAKYKASGGFKAVYEARVGNQREALKVIWVPNEEDHADLRTELAARVAREIEALRYLECPYIVKLGSLIAREVAINSHDYVVYSEEFIEGVTLAERLRSGHRPGGDECITLFSCLLDVIEGLKANNLIHRDIKPGNIMTSSMPGRPFVVLDLGIAYKLNSTAITMNPDMRQGTLPYMAPEMFDPRFRELLDFRSDLYSAAVTTYEYAAARHPIARRNEDDFTTMYRIATVKPDPLGAHRKDLSPQFCSMIDSLIRKKPALRPSNLAALKRQVEELL